MSHVQRQPDLPSIQPNTREDAQMLSRLETRVRTFRKQARAREKERASSFIAFRRRCKTLKSVLSSTPDFPSYPRDMVFTSKEGS